MSEISEKRKTDLMSAWNKICGWCKESCAGKFPNGKRFPTPHDPYIWVSLVINEAGEAAIYRGDHSSDCPTYVLTEKGVYRLSHGSKDVHGSNNTDADFEAAAQFSRNIIYDELENLIIRSWQSSIKPKILAEISWSNSIEDFQP